MDVNLLVVVCAAAIGVDKTKTPTSGGFNPQALSILPGGACRHLLLFIKLTLPNGQAGKTRR